MTELKWIGPETDIGQSCTMSEFVIEELQKQGDGIEANGTITTRDYGEHGIGFTHSWKAITENGHDWTIEHDDLGPKTSAVSIDECKKTRELLFRTLPYGSVFAQERLIVAMLLEFLKKGRETLEVPEYTGPVDPYDCSCFCLKLINGADDKIWEELTGGNFPWNCLLCSCGQRWYFDHLSKSWIRTSRKAFEVLTKHNGIMTRYMALNNGVLSLASEGPCHYR